MTIVLIAGTYHDNYLTLGGRSFLVPPEDIRAAEAAAQKAIAEATPESEIAPSDVPGAPPAAKPSRRRSKAQ